VTGSGEVSFLDFLLARFAEDEAAARAAVEPSAAAGPWITGRVASHLIDTVVYRPSPYNPELIVHAASTGYAGRDAADVAAHIARWDPARVLAECEAKRRRVKALNDRAPHPNAVPLLRKLLALEALPYVGHPDFRAEWRS
jgi:hypothetical protein